jgi:hypothetical protein
MEFKSQEDRLTAIKQATTALGAAYGELKFKEHMLTEMKQSFVSGASNNASKNPDPVAEVKPEPKVEVKSKTAPAKKPAAKKAEPKPEPETVTEITAELVVEEAYDGLAETVDCPISSATELRQVMLDRFNDSGRSAEVQAALKAALTASTGVEKVMDVTPDQIPDAYAAIMAVEA